MNTKLQTIMLVDDNPHDNFFHERTIKQKHNHIRVIKMSSALSALEYLNSLKDKPEELPDLVFLDINMPRMNGWEFLEEFDKSENELHHVVMVIMLTTSENPDDYVKAKNWNFVTDFKTKPLTDEMLSDLISKYFVD